MGAIQSNKEVVGALSQKKPATGLWGWLRGMLGRFMGSTPAGVSDQTNDEAIAKAAEKETEVYIVAPCGYRIKVPQAGDVKEHVGEVLPHVREAMAAVPPLPHVAIELIKEVQNPTATAASVARIAASDPALTASLLQTVNSAAMGINRRITAVTEAISYLGFSTVRSIVLKLQLEKVLPRNNSAAAAQARELWVHSLAVSYVTDALASRVNDVDKNLASTLGLLHDIGKLAIVTQLGQSADQSEEQAFGTDHANLGATLAHRWGLPADLVFAIRHHHHPEKAFEPTDPPALHRAVYLVKVANELAKYCYPYSELMELDPTADAACEFLGLGKHVGNLIDDKVRSAVTRAILYAAQTGGEATEHVKALLRLRRGTEADQLATAATATRIRVDQDAANAFVGTGKFTQPATPTGLKKLADEATKQQASLEISGHLRGPAAVTLAAFLANLVADKSTVEVAQSAQNGSFVMAIRAEGMAFSRRLSAENQNRGASLVEAELAGLLNLEWFTSVRISPEGDVVVFEGK